MLQRIALVVFLLLISAATAIFAAGHFGMRLPWEIAATDEAGSVTAAPAPESDTRAPVSSVGTDTSQDRDADRAATAAEQAPDTEPAPEKRTAAPTEAAGSTIAETAAALGATETETKPTASDVAIDISRISPDGASVFAGRAEPDSYVTVFENGKPAGTVKADSNGEWSLATEYKFASVDPKLTYEASRTPPPAPEPPPPPPVVAKPEPAAPATAASVASDVMRKFEKLVADAREEAQKQRDEAKADERPAGPDTAKAPDAKSETEVAAVAPETGPASAPAPAPSPPVAPKTPDVQSDAASSATRQDTPARASPTAAAESTAAASTAATAGAGVRTAEPDIIPVPIMFVYNEATLTPEGKRAADLLLEYLLLKRLAAIELTGHADERGTTEYNFDLSRDRLETVSEILRAGGYDGDLKLTPKGKTEPYMGVNRAAYKGEALYQLDRRVELRVTR